MIHLVVGTKAQLIKIAPVMAALQNKNIDYNFIFTGQHQETIGQLRENFGIKEPDAILYEGRDITGIIQMFFWTIKILSKTIFHKDQIFKKQGVKDIVLVHGDTFSTLLGALMGKMAGKKVGHVESGLRSFNLFHPFPEEITRLITFRLSDFNFCPGVWAVNNLRKHKGKKIDTEFNTLYDALELAKEKIDQVDIEVPDIPYAVVSLHRYENIFKKQKFKLIINHLLEISKNIHLLFILHPPTEKKLKDYGYYPAIKAAENISLHPRYDYFNFIKLLINSEFLITDGGSNQEEAYYLGKPTILFRSATERQDGLGSNVVISNYDPKTINDFVGNYRQYASPPIQIKKSPTEIIVSNLSQFID
jgi:UDP-N-acetylglucosamine 2-epimerase (non-hydrolysing)